MKKVTITWFWLFFCAVLIIVNQLVRLLEDQYFPLLESSTILFCPYLINYDIPLGNQYITFVVYLFLLLILHKFKGNLHDFRLEIGKWLITAGLLGNGISWLLYENVIDYIGIPPMGIATNLPDIVIFAGLVFYSFGISREIVHYYLPKWKKENYINNNQGFVLVSTVMIVTILLLFALAVLGLANSQVRTAVAYRDRNAALYVAESGINVALYKIENNELDFIEDEEGVSKAIFSHGDDVFTDGSSFDVSILREEEVNDEGNNIYKYTLTSVGKKNGKSRTIVIYAKSSTTQEPDESDDGDDDERKLKLIVNSTLQLNSANAFQLRGEASVYINGSMILNGASIDIYDSSNFYIHGDTASNSTSAYNIRNASYSPVNFFIKGSSTFWGGNINTNDIAHPEGRVNLFIKEKLDTGGVNIGTGQPDRLMIFLPNKDENNNNISGNRDISAWGTVFKAGIYAPVSEVSKTSNILGAMTHKKKGGSWSGSNIYDPLMGAIKYNGNIVFPNNSSANNGIVTLGNNTPPPFDVKFNIEPIPTVTFPSLGNRTLELNHGNSVSWTNEEVYIYKRLQINDGTLMITGPADVYVESVEVNNGSLIQTTDNVKIHTKKDITLNNGSKLIVKNSGFVYVGGKMTLNGPSKFIYEGISGDGDDGNSDEEITVPSWDISWEED
jgi:lipoprotein signal peptidase